MQGVALQAQPVARVLPSARHNTAHCANTAPHLDAALGLAPELAAAAAAQLLDLLLYLGLVVIPDTGQSNSNQTFNSGYSRVLTLVFVFKCFRMIYLV